MILPDEIKRTNRKSITIKIDRKGRLIVLAPYFCDEKSIMDFVEKKRDWIKKYTEKVKSSNSTYDIEKAIKKGRVFLLGRQYPLKFCECSRGGIIEGCFVVPVQFKDSAENYLKKWYMTKAKLYLAEMLNKQAVMLKENNFTFGLTSAKARWGSCGADRKISLNYKLLMCPDKVTEYVIIHELCHLEYMNHGKSFYEKVTLFCPNYKKYDKWLKDNAGILNAF